MNEKKNQPPKPASKPTPPAPEKKPMHTGKPGDMKAKPATHQPKGGQH